MSSELLLNLPHVVLLPFPLLGHLLPAMELAKRLASSGLVVSFMCAQHRMQNLQRAHSAEGRNPRILLVSLPDKVPRGDVAIDEGLESIIWTLQGTEQVAEVFEKLIDGMMQKDVDENSPGPGPPVCIISETLMSWSQDVANKWGIDRYVFDPSPAALVCTTFHLPRLVLEGRLPLKYSPCNRKDEKLISLIAVPGLPPLHESDFHSSLLEITPKLLHELFVHHSLRMTEAAGVLINTFYELEPLAVHSLRRQSSEKGAAIQPVGPLLPSSILKDVGNFQTKSVELPPEDRKCLEWLDTQTHSSVLYISFGSMGGMPVEQIHELALGLEASKQPFLWVIRRLPSRAHGSEQQQTTAHARPPVNDLLPEGFLLRTQKQGLIVSSWAPQLFVLSHSATGGFLTHCGWNSTLESISSGIPMLTLPLYADQRLICRMLVDQLKIALEVRRSESGLLLKDEVENKVSLLMMRGGEGDAMRERAGQLRDAARKSVENGGSSQKHLEEFVQSMYQKSKLQRNSFHLQKNCKIFE